MNQATNEVKYEFIAEDPNVKIKPIVISLIMGAFFAILNETLMNIALPTLMIEFDISVTTVQWMVTGFMLVMGIVTPISALLAQWFSTRKMFLGTLTLFTVGTVVCATAFNFPMLIFGRVLQAAGSGLLNPVIFNILLLIYPPHQRGKIMGTVSLVIMFAPAIGPSISGVVVQHLGWRFLFILVIPFTLFSMTFAYKYLKNVSEVTKPTIDVLSIILSTIGVGGVVYGFSSAGENEGGFLSLAVYIPIVVGVIAMALFAIRQLKIEKPILDLRILKFPMYRLGMIMFLIIIMAMFSSSIILPMYMQGPLALTASAAGFILLPGSLISGILSPIMGNLFDKVGPRRLLIPSTLVLSGAVFMFSQLTMQTPIWFIITGHVMLMATLITIMTAAETNGLNQLPKVSYPHGTALMMTLQPVAGAIGIALSLGLMNFRQSKLLENVATPTNPVTIHEALVSGIELVYLLAFGLTVITFILSFFVYRATPKDMKS